MKVEYILFTLPLVNGYGGFTESRQLSWDVSVVDLSLTSCFDETTND
jgi:hypothetical protein